MSEKIEFVRNYHDLSNERGFQFEFYCDRCSKAFRSEFQTSATGTITSILDTAGSLLGGLFGSASEVSDKVKNVTYQKSHDEAFAKAAKEIEPDFIHCPRCMKWVCKEDCWNDKRGLCKECAPDLGVEMSAAQVSRSVEEIWAHAAMAEEDKKLSEGNWRETIVASCPKCQAPLETNAKFCPECGEKLLKDKICFKCGAKLTENNKFCPECGAKA